MIVIEQYKSILVYQVIFGKNFILEKKMMPQNVIILYFSNSGG